MAQSATAQLRARATGANAIPVNPDNFNRAESDMVFASVVKDGGLGRFVHNREVVPVDFPIVRPSRDTLYSMAVFDLDAGAVTITLPDPGKRFMSMQVIDEDQYSPKVIYGGGTFTSTKEQIRTRYISIGVRTFVNPNDPEDLEQVHALQDAIVVEQRSRGRFEVPQWDPQSQRKVREALLALGETVPDTKGMFGPRYQVDPVRHLIGTAIGFGGNPDKDAFSLNLTPPRNDGLTIHKLTVKDVPVDGFWSISVYDARGHFVKNKFEAYTVNSVTAKKDAHGSVTVQFGGCDGKTPNCLDIMSGWNYTIRLYRPRREILDGRWKFPEAEPVTR